MPLEKGDQEKGTGRKRDAQIARLPSISKLPSRRNPLVSVRPGRCSKTGVPLRPARFRPKFRNAFLTRLSQRERKPREIFENSFGKLG